MVTRHSANGFMPISEEGRWVPHADYRALEEQNSALVSLTIKNGQTIFELTEELAALREKVGGLVEADRAFDDLYQARYVFISREASQRQKALEALQ